MAKASLHLQIEDIYDIISTWDNEWELFNYFGHIKFIEIRRKQTFSSVEDMIKVSENLQQHFGKSLVCEMNTRDLSCMISLKIEKHSLDFYPQFKKVMAEMVA